MRLDVFLTEKGYFDSRTKAKQAIERGEIYIDSKIITKSAFDISENSFNIERIYERSFVSLGGFKLDKALCDFDFSVENLICADVGASTGGFTDCLIKRNARKVYAVDLNNGLLHDSLKTNKKVVTLIKNAKELKLSDFENDRPNFIVCDLSFISATCVMPVLSNLLSIGDFMVLLIKPQFETGEKKKFKNGIIKDSKIRRNACKKIYDSAVMNGFSPIKITSAPIVEGKNVEYLILLRKGKYEIFDLNEYNF